MKIHTLVLLMAACLAFTGCSSSKTTLPYFSDIPEVAAGSLPEMDFMPVIQPDDELAISITSTNPSLTAMYNAPETNPATRSSMGVSSQTRAITYIVDSEGDIILPVLGKIHVAGKNIEQVQQQLTEIVSRTVEDPHVYVSMASFTVHVGGEVKEPQTLNVPRNRFTILEALAAAGDMTEFGERSNVLIIRENNGKREYARLDLNKSDVLTSPYYYLQPNDYIYVSPNKVRQENSKYNQNNGYKLSIISTVVSAASVIASLVIALTVK